MTDRAREIAHAILDGSARHADIAELARGILARPRPLTDAELQALAGLAAVEECAALRANNIRLMQGLAAAYDEDWESAATKRLRAEIEHRGIL